MAKPDGYNTVCITYVDNGDTGYEACRICGAVREDHVTVPDLITAAEERGKKSVLDVVRNRLKRQQELQLLYAAYPRSERTRAYTARQLTRILDECGAEGDAPPMTTQEDVIANTVVPEWTADPQQHLWIANGAHSDPGACHLCGQPIERHLTYAEAIKKAKDEGRKEVLDTFREYARTEYGLYEKLRANLVSDDSWGWKPHNYAERLIGRIVRECERK